jgi:AraC-like DNA-binding protein
LVLIVRPEFLANLHLAESPGLDWMAPFKKDPAGRLPLTRTGDRPEVLDLAWRMADLVEADDSLRPLRLRLLFMELLAFFLGREDGCQPAHDSRTDASARISPALALAFSSRRLITNQEAAQACRMVKDHFLRAFQRTMGLSFVRFAMRSRLRGAAHDVLTADLPLKAIAAQWGFTDKSHLNRLFRQHYGCTPREFRDESAHLAAADGRPGAVQRKRNAV